jgi:hypothetical protein
MKWRTTTVSFGDIGGRLSSPQPLPLIDAQLDAIMQPAQPLSPPTTASATRIGAACFGVQVKVLGAMPKCARRALIRLSGVRQIAERAF